MMRMDLTPYVERLRLDLAHAAAAASEETRDAAERLAVALDPAVRLTLMEALSQATSEITSEMRTGAVEVRLNGRDLDFVVEHEAAPAAPTAPSGAPAVGEAAEDDEDDGATARITLRLPEGVKTRAEELAAKRRPLAEHLDRHGAPRGHAGACGHHRPRPGQPPLPRHRLPRRPQTRRPTDDRLDLSQQATHPPVQESTMNRTFQTPQPVNLFIELGSGEVATHAVATDETTVEVVGPRAEEFQVEHNGSEVSVVAPKSRLGAFRNDGHRVTVSLPEGSSLRTRTGSADVVASGSYGLVRLKTGSGDVDLEEADGPVVVDSGSGGVRGHEIRGELRIKSGSGDIDLGDLHGNVGISTGSGDVLIGHTHLQAVLKSGSGDQEIRVADTNVALRTASGDITVGQAASGTITANNVSGNVRIGVPAGTPVWTDISSVTGRITSTLESLGAPREGQDHLEVRATTVSGDVLLDRV